MPSAAQVGTRSEEIEQQRKNRPPVVEERDRLKETLDFIKQNRIFERLTLGIAGVRPRFGGLVTGSGLAVGPEYFRPDLLNGEASFRASARISTRQYQRYDMLLAFPHMADGHLFAQFAGVYRNYPSINYYGPGPNSSKRGRSDFRLETTSFESSIGVQPVTHFRIGAEGEYLKINVGPGTDSRFVSSERIYSPRAAPGIDTQPDYVRGGGFIGWDNRDIPGGPRAGGAYTARFSQYSDRTSSRYSFRQLNLEAQQYIHFFNRRRVIALRARSALTDTDRGQVVPFYMQPVLGGSETLRGFRPFRFYDNNLIVGNAEYRWEVFSGLDMALFADAGKVFARWEDWNRGRLEQSYGFGFRFNVRNEVFLRIDTGFSREGFAVWLKFDNVF